MYVNETMILVGKNWLSKRGQFKPKLAIGNLVQNWLSKRGLNDHECVNYYANSNRTIGSFMTFN
jgi:hypothetical protein